MPAHAQMLLAEFEFIQPGAVQLPANYHFNVTNNHLPPLPDTRPQMVNWVDTINSVPVTQTASPEMVAQMNAITTNHPSQDRRFYILNGSFSLPFFIDRPFDAIWYPDDPSDGWRAEAFVDFDPCAASDPFCHIGRGLWGYIVTGLERTITAESQLVRIYGHPIPEPASWLLASLALCLLHRRPYRVSLS